MAKTNPFDYINSINTSKKDLMTGTANDELAERHYNPFLTNRALSYHNDTIGFANLMNCNYHLDHKLQYHFLLNIVRTKKRFAKWEKKESSGDVAIVQEYYGYNDVKARQALNILTPQQIEIIRKKLEKGGKQ